MNEIKFLREESGALKQAVTNLKIRSAPNFISIGTASPSALEKESVKKFKKNHNKAKKSTSDISILLKIPVSRKV